MLFGVRPDEQRRLAARGEKIRVYLPYGTESYPYLMRRLAERPANLTFFLRAWRASDDRARMSEQTMIAVIGAGKMGEALVSGLLKAGTSPDDLIITERYEERAHELSQRYGVKSVSNADAARQADDDRARGQAAGHGQRC